MAVITWTKSANNPLPSLATRPGTWREDATMTVDVLPRDDHFQIFYVGKKNGQDRIGIATCAREGFDGKSWADHPHNPVVSPGEAGSYDATHVVDPACVEFGGNLFLYYSAIGVGPDSIGLAVSEDGLRFRKEDRPVLIGRAPEVVKIDGTIYMLYSLDHPGGGYAFHLATSTDGRHFTEEGPIFSPEGNGWDSFSVVTPRVFHEEGLFVMAYAGDDQEKDYPKRVGLAFSQDMRTWKRFPDNPVFAAGAPDSWESRAIWFPEILKLGDRFYMWYEGYNGKCSQVGLAVSDSPIVEIGRSVVEDRYEGG
jgi:predicted GH43/DUF377 family glycosyl hydrolase